MSRALRTVCGWTVHVAVRRGEFQLELNRTGNDLCLFLVVHVYNTFKYYLFTLSIHQLIKTLIETQRKPHPGAICEHGPLIQAQNF